MERSRSRCVSLGRQRKEMDNFPAAIGREEEEVEVVQSKEIVVTVVPRWPTSNTFGFAGWMRVCFFPDNKKTEVGQDRKHFLSRSIVHLLLFTLSSE